MLVDHPGVGVAEGAADDDQRRAGPNRHAAVPKLIRNQAFAPPLPICFRSRLFRKHPDLKTYSNPLKTLGAGCRDRTRDPLITNQVLYHLS